ncbi:hypothetical protein NKDENANG_00494 [Candidatus Entotheonellaceae bacterium PAL068K]
MALRPKPAPGCPKSQQPLGAFEEKNPLTKTRIQDLVGLGTQGPARQQSGDKPRCPHKSLGFQRIFHTRDGFLLPGLRVSLQRDGRGFTRWKNRRWCTPIQVYYNV